MSKETYTSVKRDLLTLRTGCEGETGGEKFRKGRERQRLSVASSDSV